MKRVLPPHLFVACALAMLGLHRSVPGSYLSGATHLVAGVLIMMVGLGAAVWGSRRFKAAETNIVTFEAPQVLVTDGLFRWSRNPMYLGFLVALAGLWLAFGSVSPGLMVLAFAVVTDRWYIAFEERLMAKTFGASYEAYRAQTRRWI